MMEDFVDKGIRVTYRSSWVTHLLFADDSLLFFEASRAQAENVKAALMIYGAATGQNLNYNKCSLFFGGACPEVAQAQVRDALNVTSLVFEEKYLGSQRLKVVCHEGNFRIYCLVC